MLKRSLLVVKVAIVIAIGSILNLKVHGQVISASVTKISEVGGNLYSINTNANEFLARAIKVSLFLKAEKAIDSSDFEIIGFKQNFVPEGSEGKVILNFPDSNKIDVILEAEERLHISDSIFEIRTSSEIEVVENESIYLVVDLYDTKRETIPLDVQRVEVSKISSHCIRITNGFEDPISITMLSSFGKKIVHDKLLEGNSTYHVTGLQGGIDAVQTIDKDGVMTIRKFLFQ